MTRKGEVRIYDTTLSVWEDHVDEPAFYREVFGPLIKRMRELGWKVGQDPRIKKHYSSLNQTHRLCSKRELRATIEVCGRCIELKIWSENWKKENQNGHRYDFNKQKKMPFLTGLRCDLEIARIRQWLIAQHGYSTTDDFDERPGKLTPLERIAKQYAESCHVPVRPGWPKITCEVNARSADGDQIKHGQTVWFRGRDGRVRRGTAYYGINNMWNVIAGGNLEWMASFDICTKQPLVLGRLTKERTRRERIEALINAYVAADAFAHANKLLHVLFGGQPLYRIQSKKHDGAYWRPCEAGYSNSTAHAGRYTRDEATRLVARNPAELTAVPIGLAPALVEVPEEMAA